MKIAVYAIAKNEIHNVQDWYENVKGAEGIYVLDTGSSDGTAKALRDLGVNCNYRNLSKQFRFDDARNESLAYVPNDYDVCISLDFDERLQPDWREVVEAQYKGGSANYTLVFDYDTDGNIITSYPRLGIHARHDGVWAYPVHEVLDTRAEPYNIDLICVHQPKEQKAPGHYLELLKIGVVERPRDARAHQYLAREYMYMNQFSFAIHHYRQALEFEKYAPFRGETYIKLAQIEDFLGNDAESLYLKAIAEYPYVREPFCAISEYYYRNGNAALAYGFAERAQMIERPDINYVFRDDYYSYWCYHMMFSAAVSMGMHDKAKEYAFAAINACGDKINQRLLKDIINSGLVHVETDSNDSESEPQDIPENEQQGTEGIS